jgi:hypothetical protein
VADRGQPHVCAGHVTIVRGGVGPSLDVVMLAPGAGHLDPMAGPTQRDWGRDVHGDAYPSRQLAYSGQSGRPPSRRLIHSLNR